MEKSNLFKFFLATLLLNTFSSYACENTPPSSPETSRKKTSHDRSKHDRSKILEGNMARMLFLAVIASSVTPEPLSEQDTNSPVLARKSPTKRNKK